MKLYTVHMDGKVQFTRIVSGRATEVTETVPQTYRDLPFVTAQRYLERFPDSNVRIVEQDGFSNGKSVEITVRGQKTAGELRSFESRPKLTVVSDSKPASAKKTVKKAADYADVVNSIIEEEMA